MRYRLTAVLLATIVAGFMFCCTPKMDVGLGKAKGFSADLTVRSKMGPRTHVLKGKLYAAKNGNSRVDIPPYSINIVRRDKKVAWTLLPEQKQYMEGPVKTESAFYGGGEVPGEISRKKIGEEVIDGQRTKKYEIKYMAKAITGKEVEDTMIQWISVDTGIPIKMALANGTITYEYHNVKVGRQPDDLFELPAGYTKMAMP